MPIPSGYNPVRWNCQSDGCFNIKRRPKIELFADCFPRKINFGDIDGAVELGGFFCLLEWKGQGGRLRTAQELMFKRLSSTLGNYVICVEGDAQTMDVKRYCEFWHGKQGKWKEARLEDVKVRLRRWAIWAGNTRRASLTARLP